MKHKNRIDRIAGQLPSGDDDTIIIIRLAWPEQDPEPPIVCRRGRGGQLIRKVGIDTIPVHLRGPEINVHWDDDITIIE